MKLAKQSTRKEPNLFLKSLRDCVGMNQTEFAELVGMRQQHYSRLESGERDPTKIQQQAIMMATYIALHRLDEYAEWMQRIVDSIHE